MRTQKTAKHLPRTAREPHCRQIQQAAGLAGRAVERLHTGELQLSVAEERKQVTRKEASKVGKEEGKRRRYGNGRTLAVPLPFSVQFVLLFYGEAVVRRDSQEAASGE